MHPITTPPPLRRTISRVQWEAVGDIRLELAGHARFPPGGEGQMHSHPFWELILIGSGKGTLLRDESVGKCDANDVFIIRPGEKHRFAAGPSATMEHLYLGFSFHLTPPTSWMSAPPRSLVAGTSTDQILSELREIRLRLQQLGRAPIQESLRARILLVISRTVEMLISGGPTIAPTEAKKKALPVQAAMDFIASNFCDKLSVADLAKQCCLSPKYFGKVFKESTGQSVKQYQLRMRLLRARELMERGGLSITTIAGEVGFENLPYFSRLFKREFRVPPSHVLRNP